MPRRLVVSVVFAFGLALFLAAAVTGAAVTGAAVPGIRAAIASDMLTIREGSTGLEPGLPDSASAGLLAAASDDEPQGDQGAHADIPEDAGRFLENLGRRAVDELTDGAIDESEREARFRILLRQSFDLGAIGRFVLGKYWRRATQAQQDAFIDVFEDTIVQRFLPMFRRYSGETFSVGRLRRDENNPAHIFVTTVIEQPNGQKVTLEWRLRERSATHAYKVIDVHAEGVSMAITLRQEYASVVRLSGLDHLIEELRRKVESGDFAPKEAGGAAG